MTDGENVLREFDSGEQNEKLLIGIGGLGIELIRKVQWRSDCPIRTIVIDRADVLTETDNERFLALDSLPPHHPRSDMISASRDAEKILPELQSVMGNSGFAVIVTGLGGGVGSGVAPVISRFLHKANMSVLVLPVMPDREREGRKCALTADLAMTEIKKWADGLLVLNNGLLLPNGSDSRQDGVDKQIMARLQVVIDALFDTGLVSIDLSSLKNIIAKGTDSTIIVTSASGKDRGRMAAQQALSDPLISSYLNRSASVIVHVLAGEDLTLFELDEAASLICENWGGEVDLTYGASMDPNLSESLRIGIIVSAAPERDASINLMPANQAIPFVKDPQTSTSYPIAVTGN
jgi:cell division protein FtsZ